MKSIFLVDLIICSGATFQLKAVKPYQKQRVLRLNRSVLHTQCSFYSISVVPTRIALCNSASATDRSSKILFLHRYFPSIPVSVRCLLGTKNGQFGRASNICGDGLYLWWYCCALYIGAHPVAKTLSDLFQDVLPSLWLL